MDQTTKSQQPATNDRIAFLDYLRIFAFISVLVGHKFADHISRWSVDTTLHSTMRFAAGILVPVIRGGGAGVVAFFLVSGYIIIHVLQKESSVEFLIKRIFRIYPLYIVAVICQYILLTIEDQAPSLKILLQQTLLIGDFYATPYSIRGVEWTLRVEVVFYIFMALLASMNLMVKYKKALPYALVVATIFCRFIAPIPSGDIWSHGYLTIYGPFLFLGSMVYLYEKRQVSMGFLMFFTGLIFFQYCSLMAIYQKKWLDADFAMLAFLIFIVTWATRKYLKVTPLVMLMSEMTYAVYLFHNWIFDYAKRLFAHFEISIFNADIQALVLLLIISFIMTRSVEKFGIYLGRVALKAFRQRPYRKLKA